MQRRDLAGFMRERPKAKKHACFGGRLERVRRMFPSRVVGEIRTGVYTSRSKTRKKKSAGGFNSCSGGDDRSLHKHGVRTVSAACVARGFYDAAMKLTGVEWLRTFVTTATIVDICHMGELGYGVAISAGL